jgi:hypothetical protein
MVTAKIRQPFPMALVDEGAVQNSLKCVASQLDLGTITQVDDCVGARGPAACSWRNSRCRETLR